MIKPWLNSVWKSQSFKANQLLVKNLWIEKNDLRSKKKKNSDHGQERGLTVEQARTEYTAEYANHKYKKTERKIRYKGPIFYTEEHGGTIEVILNTDHAWYKKIYLDTSYPMLTEGHGKTFSSPWVKKQLNSMRHISNS